MELPNWLVLNRQPNAKRWPGAGRLAAWPEQPIERRQAQKSKPAKMAPENPGTLLVVERPMTSTY
jgi:hypothetical protein